MSEWLATIYDPIVAPFDSFGVRRWRQWVVSAAQGRVLELGVGTGLNLPHYRMAKTVTAIDPDSASLQRALSRSHRTAPSITLSQASAEALPFENESFDTVVGTLTFCTIPDADRALGEARRVLKPGGMFRLVEHVRVENRLIGGAQDAVTPLWKQIAGGCHLNRDTLSAVERAGFHVHGVNKHIGGLFIGIDAVK